MQPFKKNSHCSYCGYPFEENHPWPRRCAVCHNVSFLNPIPVAVILVPVDEGLLVIRRGIEPNKGKLALPGGFIDLGESWQAAATRELREETGIIIQPDQIEVFDVLSAPDGTILIFGITAPLASADLPPFEPTDETTERVILTAPTDLAFPLHARAVGKFFRLQNRPANSTD